MTTFSVLCVLCVVDYRDTRAHTRHGHLRMTLLLWLYRSQADSANAVEGERFLVHKNGSLEIHHATKEDMGEYSCFAQNTEGKVAISSTLEVKGKRNGWSDGKSVR